MPAGDLPYYFQQLNFCFVAELAADPKWRVRLAIISHIPTLAEHLGPAFFEQKMGDLCMDWLSDQVFSVRQVCFSPPYIF